MSAQRDRFVATAAAKDLMYGTGAVALLKPAWAKANGIRTGLTPKDKTRVYSVNDIAAYKERLNKERQELALASKDVVLWRKVVDRAVLDGNAEAEAWANGVLAEYIAASDDDIIDAEGIALD